MNTRILNHNVCFYFFRNLRNCHNLQDTFDPFFAKASEKLEAVQEADDEASPENVGDKEKVECSTGGDRTEGDDASKAAAAKAAAEHSSPESEAVSDTPEGEKLQAPKCDASTGETSEAQEADTVEPMSQEGTCGVLDGSNRGGAKEQMSQESAVRGLDETLDPTEGGEPMSQSGPEEPMSQETVVDGLDEPISQLGPEQSEEILMGKAQEQVSSPETASAPEGGVPGRKRAAPGLGKEQTGDGIQNIGDQGVVMETDETP